MNFIDFNFIVDYLLQLSSPYTENKINSSNQEKRKLNEKSSEKKKINSHNNILITEPMNESTPNNNSFDPKFIMRRSPDHSEFNKIPNTIESVNNNNFAIMLNKNYQSQSNIFRFDSKYFIKVR